jgi:hypothetical protein
MPAAATVVVKVIGRLTALAKGAGSYAYCDRRPGPCGRVLPLV